MYGGTNRTYNMKVIKIPIRKIAIAFQRALSLEGRPLISIKKITRDVNNSIHVKFQHDNIRYEYIESDYSVGVYQQIIQNKQTSYKLLTLEVKDERN